MTIKEMETQSGMTRANIRFYEAEGLLAPVRRENKYRDYSENDLEILKRIKLLRALDMSLEEIKALHTGKQKLVDVLEQHLVKLQFEKENIEQSQEICKIMRKDNVHYQTLDAQHYLDVLKQDACQTVSVSDVIPEVHAPWRRFFARSIDCFLYFVIWGIILLLVFNVNITARSVGGGLFDDIVVLLLMLFLEPALLSLFGTTAGKWLLGLRVTDNEGNRLTYREACNRTWKVFVNGMGFSLPVYNLFRLWKSYKACAQEETLDWEYDSAITLKDEKNWRIAAYIGVCAALFIALSFAFELAKMPKNRGEITVAEFCENYNRLSKFYDIDTGSYLNAEGHWVKDENLGNVIIINRYDSPIYQFSETDGIMTGARFSTQINESKIEMPDYQNEMILSVLSFAAAQEENMLLSKEIKEVICTIQESPFESFTFSAHGVRITCDVQYSGYDYVEYLGMLFPREGEENSYSFSFSIEKEPKTSAEHSF